MTFGVPNHCAVCGRKCRDDDEVCSALCEAELDVRRDAPGDWEQAQQEQWLSRWDERDERRRAA